VKKIEWMVAAGAVAALAGAVYSAGCVNTAGDCTLLGTSCTGEGGAGSTTGTTTTTTATASVSASASSSTGTGGADALASCEGSRFGDMADQAARSVLVGPSGDILLAGDFHGTLSIGIDTVNASSPTADDLFVARLDANQQPKLLKSFAVSYGAVARDPAGGIVLAGTYVNAADFGGSCAPLDGTSNFYVAKLDIDGKCQWAKGFGFSAPDVHASLAVDANGNIALVGDAVGPMDFDASVPGTLQLIGNNPGLRDIFAVQLDSMGKVVKAVGFGGKGDDVANGVAFDSAGGMVITGTFQSAQIDFGSGLLKNATGLDHAFVAGILGLKGFSLDFAATATGAQHATAVVVAGSLAVVAGDYTGTLGTLTSTGAALFLLGIDPATGKQAWGKSFDGKGAKSITAGAVSADGVIALTGSLDGDVDFGGGPLSSAGGAIVATFKADGTTVSHLAFGAAASAPLARGVSFQGPSILVAGSFATKIDLGNSVTVDSAGGTDVFVAKLGNGCP
jgi:hypothetical protein